MKEVESFLNNKLNDNDTVILALSGGPDSMCLLELLKTLDKNIKIVCAHVNHQTRKENESEYKFIKDYLKKDNITLEYYKIKSYHNGRFSEAEAREKRYQFFRTIYQNYHAKYLLTAHHGDDLVETIIMRILRKSSLKGYAGILEESNQDGMRILRPLLRVNKNDILLYLKEKNIPYVIDSSNESDSYLRNRIRHSIRPLLEEEPNYVDKFLKFSKTLQESSNIIEREMDALYSKIIVNNNIIKKEFLKLKEEEQNYLLRKYFHENYKNRINRVQDKHITLCRDLLVKNRATLSIPDHKIWYVQSTYACITNQLKIKPYHIKLEDEVVLPNLGIVKRIPAYEQKNNYEIHLNSKDIKLPLYITTRKNGMRMEVKNLKGSKKVNDILIDKKIEKLKRDEIPIMIDANNTVLWILGVSKSKYDVLKEEKYDIIYKYEKKEREGYEKKES